MRRTDPEIDFMGAAIELAAKGLGHTRPNPAVGAVVVKDGKVLGRGYHRRCGGAHAEVGAIKDALRKKQSLKGATICVTLEPCSRPGRVGACTDAIVAAGIKKVVYAIPDPNPKNRGKAKRALRRHGIEAFCLATDFDQNVFPNGHYVKLARQIIAPFAKHVTTGLPYVSIKLAMSLDGKICDDSGDARWVSSKDARKRTCRYREEVDVMMVGAETVRRDNPSLLCHTRRNDDLWRAVVSKSGNLPKAARVFTDAAKDRTLVYRDAVEAVRDLGRRGFLHVLCEGGLKLATALAEAGLVDEWITVLAPKVIGTRPIAEAVLFRKSCVGFPEPGGGAVIAHFGRKAEGALS